jgi:ubiquinone/menaquinone biosynthesis C-methylase UbiE
MSMTGSSQSYFAENAEAWDGLRSAYFTEEVRKSAISKAYLRPQMIVADVGAGTGFMAAGLAPLVKKVFVLDGSPEMLAVARRNLHEHSNVDYHLAEGLDLPLPSDSLDAVFANMYLHHLPEPLAAIREMARLLKPGGRLVITDMDPHPYQWLKEEMADVWMGFDRSQIQAWFEEADLVNIIVDCTGQSCCAESRSEATPEDQRQANISVFVAAGTRSTPGVRQSVQEHYAEAARGGGSCCQPANSQTADCCTGGSSLISLDAVNLVELFESEVVYSTDYSKDELVDAPIEAAEFSLGCGNPGAFARILPGMTVLDIGSGGGLDAFLATKQVGPTGKVIGVDMTPEMLARARSSARKAGYTNIEFRQGAAEQLPVEDDSVDIVISNCVINLTADKGKVFREIYRVLKPGGRLEVSDMVTNSSFLPDERANASGWAACINGALPEQEYLDLVQQAGFRETRSQRSSSAGNVNNIFVYSTHISGIKLTS